jgi:hypothetical protein
MVLGLSAVLLLASLMTLAWANHVFQYALVIHNDTRAMFKRMNEGGPGSPHHEIPPPAPSPDVSEHLDMTVDAPPGHNPHGQCDACGSQWCREAGTKPAPDSTKGLPKVPGSDDVPSSEPPGVIRTLVGLSPSPTHRLAIRCPSPESKDGAR